ncbi:hypothetical protein [Halogeometricum pallidum]|uniref:hypothetical protein n=1 Tax=Halogeometricum pallidum TaxID=411361 RepID=UPI0009FCD6ED|nr:hypothetical protein [Halogeometricum pallidum]
MGDGSVERDWPTLSEDLTTQLDGLTAQQLREVIEYAQWRLREMHQPVSRQIEAGPGEEILSVEDRPEYTKVVKREPCGDDCPDCPHGPYLYHVYEEIHPDRESSLHWVFLGRLYEPPSKNSPD